VQLFVSYVLTRCSEDAEQLFNLAIAANSELESPVSIAYCQC